ncbi:MAG: hypothetical protein ACRCXT_16450 [Paraclostridium sp.]
MIINIQIDSKKDKETDILQVINFLLGKNDVEIKKSISVSEARKKLRTLAKLGKVELAQELVNKHCGGSIDTAPEYGYEKLIEEIDEIIN